MEVINTFINKKYRFVKLLIIFEYSVYWFKCTKDSGYYY